MGDFLLGALALRGDEALAYSELLEIAGDNGLNISTVLAWATQAEEGGLLEQVPHPDGGGRALRLTQVGIELSQNNRRRVDRRARWAQAPDNFL